VRRHGLTTLFRVSFLYQGGPEGDRKGSKDALAAQQVSRMTEGQRTLAYQRDRGPRQVDGMARSPSVGSMNPVVTVRS
jgi:hypothetical protein